MKLLKKIFKKESADKTHLHVNPIICLAFCFFIYMPKFNISTSIIQILSLGIPALYLLTNIKLLQRFNFRQWIIISFAIILSVLSGLFPITHGTGDYSYFLVSLSFFKNAITYAALLCLIAKKHRKEKAIQYFMYYYALTHVAYVVGTILLVSFPVLHDTWFSIVEKEQMVGNYAGRLFRVGWLGFSGFRLTLHCTISVAFLLYLKYRAGTSIISNRQFFLSIIGCVVGNMFYGRSGLIVSLLIITLALLYWNKKNIKRLLVMFTVITLLVLGASSLKNIPGLSNWYDWMSSPIVNLITTGDMQDKSFDKLQEMQQVEINKETILYGDGYYNKDGHYYMETDAGFIRNILFWGILGAIISYSGTIYAIFSFSKLNKLLVLQLLTIFLAFEYKGAVYYEFLPLAFITCTSLRDPVNKVIGAEKEDV